MEKFLDPQVWVLVGLIVTDFATGITSAIIAQNLNSKLMREGIVSHSIIAILIVLLNFSLHSKVDEQTHNLLSTIFNLSFAGFMTSYLLSIFENLVKMNVKVPKSLSKYLKGLEDDEDEKN